MFALGRFQLTPFILVSLAKCKECGRSEIKMAGQRNTECGAFYLCQLNGLFRLLLLLLEKIKLVMQKYWQIEIFKGFYQCKVILSD